MTEHDNSNVYDIGDEVVGLAAYEILGTQSHEPSSDSSGAIVPLFRDDEVANNTEENFREASYVGLVSETSSEDAQTTFARRLGRVVGSALADRRNASFYGKTIQVTALTTQIVERARVSEFIVAPVAVNVLRDTQSPAVTSLAILAMVGTMQGAIGHSWAEAIDKSSATVAAINSEFPKLNELAEDIGPAREKKWYSHLREGASTFLTYGVTPFVVAEKINNPEMTRREMHISTAKMTGKCALFGFGAAYAISETLLRIDPEAASTAMDVIDKPYTWMGLAALFEAPRFIKKRYNRHKVAKDATTTYNAEQ